MGISVPNTMAELRWILLAAGLVFLLALAAWELQRGRRARRAAAAEAEHAAREALLGQTASRTEPRDSWQPRAPEHSLDIEPSSALTQSELAATAALEPPVSSQRIEPTLIEADPVDPAAPMMPAVPVGASAQIEVDPPLRVEWPEERERRILAVRVVAPPGERLPGRLVRQALRACGFVHGPYRIYHQPAADGRSLLSCANLTKPGDFDPLTLDFQRLTGLSVFTVLPGPLPALAALDHLLETATDLAQRLNGALADERGAELNAARLAALRATAEQSPRAAAPSAAGAERTRGA